MTSIDVCPRCGVPGEPHASVPDCADALIAHYAAWRLDIPTLLDDPEIKRALEPTPLPEQLLPASLVVSTLGLQRNVEKMLRLAIDVLRGPDPTLRAQAIETLENLADEMANSNARLEEL